MIRHLSLRRGEHALWILAGAGVLATALAVARTSRGIAPSPLPAAAPADLRLHPPPDSVGMAVETITEGNLFRPERRSIEADEIPVTVAAPPAHMQPPRPRLVLRGIIGGPPWDAVVEGVPGRDGAVVLRIGQPSAGLTLRAVRRDTVIVHGLDTTWTLSLSRAW